MKVYHGTNMIIDEIDLSKSRNRVDFGKGFYLTDKLGTARDWAIRKVELEGEGIPTVLCYELDQGVFDLSGMRYANRPCIAWLEFICFNRSILPTDSAGREPRHKYNWVTGPIADDKVVDVVAEYMRDEIDDKEAIKRLRALPQTYQISLHTIEAVQFLNDNNVTYKQLHTGRWAQNWISRKI